ncbi:hypothetical protein, partial [Enterobacter hormaechei]|uniref:hypothetical protein n=1 Tax=Enterobacter hormaechei TaxID=158836 RepID=UPI00195448CE
IADHPLDGVVAVTPMRRPANAQDNEFVTGHWRGLGDPFEVLRQGIDLVVVRSVWEGKRLVKESLEPW